MEPGSLLLTSCNITASIFTILVMEKSESVFILNTAVVYRMRKVYHNLKGCQYTKLLRFKQMLSS